MSTNLSTTSSTLTTGPGPKVRRAWDERAKRHVRRVLDMAILPRTHGSNLMTLLAFGGPTRATRVDLHELVCDCGHGQTLHRARVHSNFARCLACDGMLAAGQATPRGDACVVFEARVAH